MAEDSGAEPGERYPQVDVLEGVHDPAALGASLATDLRSRVRAALVSAGFAEQELEAAKGSVTSAYLDWLKYLLAVHHRGDVIAIASLINPLSTAHPADISWLGEIPCDTLRVECTRAEFPRRDESLDLIIDFLASHAAVTEEAMA
jgi:hypothetical protein